MTNVDIDYSNTIFYKIFCKDSTIKDIYVGMTTNFVQRKRAHKQSCNNEKAADYNSKKYNAIRNAGGWDNWQMEIIGFHNCKDSYEAHKKEQEYFEMLGATLNSIEPLPKSQEHSGNLAQEIHNNSNKHHKMISMHKDTNLTPKSPVVYEKSNNYECIKCNFNCSKLSNWNTHLLTRKHQNATQKEISSYSCICNKRFKHHSSYYRHKKACSSVLECDPIEKVCSSIPDTDVVSTIMKMMQIQNETNKELVETNKKMYEKLEKLSINYKQLANCGPNLPLAILKV